jgi:hypothetical protein
MSISTITARLLAAGALLAIPVLAGSAGAADPKPEPCAGMFSTDAAGDATIPAGNIDGGDEPAPANMDLLGTFLNFKGGVLTYNLKIKDLSKKLPEAPQATGGIYYYGHWAYQDDISRFVKAVNKSGDAITYHYGVVVFPGSYFTLGTTTGSFSEGPEGVVSIVVPAAQAPAGGTLPGLLAAVDAIEGEDDVAGFNLNTDSDVEKPDPIAPNGADYTVAECPAAPAVTATPTPSATPSAGPGGGGTTTSKPAAQPTALPISVSSAIGSAKKVKKARGLALKVNASKPVTGFQVQLKKAGPKGAVVAQGKAAQLKKGANTVKLKAKRLKAGRYEIVAVGNVDGQIASYRKAVTLKK